MATTPDDVLKILKDKEVTEELVECRKRGTRTPRYMSLLKDASKLKAEYEKVKATGISDPLNVSHGERFSAQKLYGDIMGRSGPDTHHGIGGDMDRKS